MYNYSLVHSESGQYVSTTKYTQLTMWFIYSTNRRCFHMLLTKSSIAISGYVLQNLKWFSQWRFFFFCYKIRKALVIHSTLTWRRYEIPNRTGFNYSISLIRPSFLAMSSSNAHDMQIVSGKYFIVWRLNFLCYEQK